MDSKLSSQRERILLTFVFMSTQDTGKAGEKQVKSWMERHGYILLEENYRFGPNEIDLVALEGNELVFAEVKTRTPPIQDWPERFVSKGQQQRYFKVADAFVYEKKMVQWPVRFDIFSVLIYPEGKIEIEHFRDAFGKDDTLQQDIGYWEEY